MDTTTIPEPIKFGPNTIINFSNIDGNLLMTIGFILIALLYCNVYFKHYICKLKLK